MVLIVDDDPRFLEQAEKLITSDRGVFFALDADHAKDLIRSIGGSLSVALVDLNLPGQDGFSLIRELRQHFPDLPLIAISGVLRREALESARLLGATDALRKPITAEWKEAISRARAING
jgi:CheY-like chemotaxis protein